MPHQNAICFSSFAGTPLGDGVRRVAEARGFAWTPYADFPDELMNDGIGNATLAARASTTNAYAANALNQYTSISRVSVPPCETIPTYDADGNLVFLGPWTYAYDAANRLTTVSSNGVPLVANAYDAQGRRVRKTTLDATTTFFYDDWNLVEERIACTNGTTSTVQYHWGKDFSGSLQGAGGIGGLLYLKIDGILYIPLYDANGNVTKYLDANGGVVASYTYDAFGNLLAQSGDLADTFAFRFSTKYHDVESNLYYFGRRFYWPALRRWLNRDPIAEDGGVNLYAFCGNNPVCRNDVLGCAHFEVRALKGAGRIWSYSCFGWIIGTPLATILDLGLADKLNIEILHEHLFYDDGANVGYSAEGFLRNEEQNGYVRRDQTEYDDCIMREAEQRVSVPPYSLLGWGRPKFNCQDYADRLRSKYNEIKNEREVKCKCGKNKTSSSVLWFR